jgi:hypothetical protein
MDQAGMVKPLPIMLGKAPGEPQGDFLPPTMKNFFKCGRWQPRLKKIVMNKNKGLSSIAFNRSICHIHLLHLYIITWPMIACGNRALNASSSSFPRGAAPDITILTLESS